MLDIKRLYYFVKVANENSFTKASKKLYISQPALSKQIKILEDEVGTSLFKRDNNKLFLTENGQYLYDKSMEILSLINSVEENIDKEKEINGIIKIGAAETKGLNIISTSFSELKKRYNDVKIDIISGNASQVLNDLDKGLVDFAIVVEPVLKKSNYDYIRLNHTEIWGLLTLEDGIFRNRDVININDLLDIPLFTSFQDFHSSLLNNLIGETEQEFNIIGHYNLINNIVYFIKSGIGHAICLKDVYNIGNDNLKFIPLYPQNTSDLSIVWKKNSMLSSTGRKFLDILKQVNNNIEK